MAASAAAGWHGVEHFRWAVTGSAHFYREPLMWIAGPSAGLRSEAQIRWGERAFLVEGELGVGVANYSSPESGSIEGFLRTGSALHVHAAQTAELPWVPRPGFGVTTEWTDLRGQSSLGKQGYERFNLALWLSATWDVERDRAEGATRVRAAIMARGWQSSMLSQASPAYLNVINEQNRGGMMSVERPFRIDGARLAARLSVRAVGRSNLVDGGSSPVYEPANHTIDLTLTLWR